MSSHRISGAPLGTGRAAIKIVSLGDAELLKMSCDIFSGAASFDFLIDVPDLAVYVDEKRPPVRESTLAENAVCLCDTLVGVAQNRVIALERLSKLLVVFGGVDADREVSHVHLLERCAVRTERLALGRS